MNAYDRGLFLWTEQCLCHVWLRNAAVLGDRGALWGPYVTPGCLEAAHRGGVSNGTQPTYMTVTSGGIHDQKPGQKSHLIFFFFLFSRSDLKIVCSSVYCSWKPI